MAGWTRMWKVLASAVLLAGSARGHGGLNNYTVGETWYRGYDPNESAAEQVGQPWLVQRVWQTIDPVFSVSDKALACNTPGSPATSYIPIQAGENITALYYYWLHPVGPMSAWLAACGDDGCENVDVNALNWFKIWHAGLVDDGARGLAESQWYQKNFQRWDGEPAEWPVTIPPTLKPGYYLIRHDIISIHIPNKPQFYPECAHLNITGTGSALPPATFYKKIPGVYSMDDPLINIDVYSDASTNTHTYEPPGGPIWDGFLNKYCQGC